MARHVLTALFLLRNALFLGPLALAVLLLARTRGHPRRAVAAFFALLYGLSLVFVGHVLAIQCGAWSYGGTALKVLGLPADIWFGGALLWGPVLFLAFPGVNPWVFVLGCTALNGLLLPVLAPFYRTGPDWFPAVVLVFLTAHLPALFLARWTEADVRLPWRAFLLAVAYAGLAYGVVPSLIMQAMGGSWAPVLARPAWVLVLAGLAMGVIMVLGLTAVQMFALHGEGTAIPLDPTKRLVRTGIYAYLTNAMQLSTALAWLVFGAVLGNPWVALAAGMAVLFVVGLVRWHNRQDLGVRFPVGWPEYRAHVPDWLPRWRPWVPEPATLHYDPARHRWLPGLLARTAARGLDLRPGPGPLVYREPYEAVAFTGVAAAAKALNHGNFATALLGAAMLLAVLPATALWRLARPRRE